MTFYLQSCSLSRRSLPPFWSGDDMTRDEILKMSAGREMDALIAEKVTELSWIIFDGKDPAADELTPEYSTNIAVAWQVVEKMREKEFEFFAEWKTEKAVNRSNSQPWACFSPEDETRPFDAAAETMPLAICRAALLAVMECE